MNVGVLNMQTDDTLTVPANNFAVMRVSNELPNRSGIGAMFVNRTATGSASRSDDFNRTFGADARLGVGEYFTMAGFAARTETPGLTGRDYAYNVDSEYNDSRHRVGFEYGTHRRGLQPRGRLPARTKMAIVASCSGSTRRCDSRRFGIGASVNGSRTSTTRGTTTSMVA